MRAAILVSVSFIFACCGCEGGGGEERAFHSLPTAAAHTLDSLPYRFDVTIELRSNGSKVVGHGHGAGDRDTMEETVRYPPVVGRDERPPSRYLLDEREGRLDSYVDNPAPDMAGGKHWLKFDLLPTFHRYGLEPSDVPGANLRSPTRFFEALRRFHSNIRKVGTETVGGTTLTRYHVHLDDNDIVRSASPAKRPAVRQLLGMANVQLDADVWVDESGMITRLRQKEHTAAEVTVQTLRFHDWGKPFTFQLPPPEDVADGNTLGR
jgi:hypothetical protein